MAFLILVVNAGSSSLKLRVLDDGDRVRAQADLPGKFTAGQVRAAVASLGQVDAVAHRVVHGGTLFREPARIDPEVRAKLDSLTDLAPLHQPKSLAALDTVTAALPSVPAVACFDTAFHATIPPPAATFALPASWRSRWALRRYGFHGLSHAYVARRATAMTGARRVVSCHLGAGASLAAVLDGRSVDTTMSFTPLDGLVMATRSGSVDPGLVLWLCEHEQLAPHEVSSTLEHESGLLGLAGTGDMRSVLAAAASGDQDAELAREVYLHRLRAHIAAMAAAMAGLDVVVFTGGVGENSAEVRARALDGLGFLGVRCDARLNADLAGDGSIGERALVIAAREDIEMASQTRAVLTP